MVFKSLTEVSDLIRQRTISPVEVTEACLARIEKLNPVLNAFITVTAESALQEARKAEAEIMRGEWRGPLHGVPLAIKDLVETAGVATTAGSAVLKDFIPAQDAVVVQKLRAAGVVLLGKLNLHEFAYGGSAIISHFGTVRNPWDTKRITGGSSSGSAASVAAGLCYGAIGTDTGGSIRLPAAMCGIVGFKPTYGLVSTRGVIPLCWSYDHVGPMTRTVTDAALMLAVIAGYDSQDACSREFPAIDYTALLSGDAQAKKCASLRLGVVRGVFCEKLDTEIEKAITDAVSVLGKITTETQDIQLPDSPDRTVFRCEPYAYHQKYLATRADQYHPETLRRIRAGAAITAAEYIEKRRELELERREVEKVFQKVDLLVTPTCPILPPEIAALEAAPDDLREKELLMLRNTRPFNILGLPTISIPCGFSQSGLPIGLQITGASGAEEKVLMLAHVYERATKWHTRKPSGLFTAEALSR